MGGGGENFGALRKKDREEEKGGKPAGARARQKCHFPALLVVDLDEVLVVVRGTYFLLIVVL